jgi:dTDP-4-amino-4,6-dideoxygalactose transaminase
MVMMVRKALHLRTRAGARSNRADAIESENPMTWRVPLVDLHSLHRPIREEILEAVARCLERQSFILGEEVVELEEAIAAYCEVPFALGMSSGTDALLASLMAYGIGPGDEVVTTAFSFFATAGEISRLGATPVFVDIEEESFNVDPAGIEEKLTERTRAIVPVHLYGQCANMSAILALADERGVVVIEDAAQAIGARDSEGRRAGSMGNVGAFSFYPSKNLGALGDAGMVVTREEGLFETLKRLRTHGASREYLHDIVGGNFRMDGFQAAALRVKLRYLDEWTRERRERARCYHALFAGSSLLEEGKVRTPKAPGDHVYHQYVIRAERRDELRAHLSQQGIATAIYYPVPLHLQPCFRDLGYVRGEFPAAEKAAGENLALPMFPALTEEQQALVVSAIDSFYRG